MKKIQSIQKEYRQVGNSSTMEETEYAYIFDDQTMEVTKVKVNNSSPTK